ncbi:glycosyltransferase family 4 protein [Owenweeksia hongkongensis]|uniref:glycosyltransferase family 4 protein n=1 Tax=Owenweeksia hongkongensis TaxID=253245 RepID=UPI003A90B411
MPEYTGASYRVHNTYKRIGTQFSEFDLRVICNSTENPDNCSYKYDGLPVDRVAYGLVKWLPNRLARALKYYLEALGTFYKLCSHEKPDVLHIIGSSGGTAAALIYSRFFSIPRVLELVTKGASPEQFLPGLRYKHFLQLDRKTVIIAISPEIEQRCHSMGYVENVWCRPNPVDETRFFFDSSRKHARRQYITPFSKNDVVIGMVAKFMPQKNQMFLLDVLARLPQNYKLVLAGPLVDDGIFFERDQEYFQEIGRLIEIKNLSDRVYIEKGFVDAAKAMAALDIYAMPQVKEGLGTPMLEAIASGLPVVANADESAFAYWVSKTSGGVTCSLNVDIWVKAILDVSEISERELRVASELTLEYAGHLVHDNIFVNLLKILVEDEPSLLGFVKKLGASDDF